jgi:hypothetical protein
MSHANYNVCDDIVSCCEVLVLLDDLKRVKRVHSDQNITPGHQLVVFRQHLASFEPFLSAFYSCDFSDSSMHVSSVGVKPNRSLRDVVIDHMVFHRITTVDASCDQSTRLIYKVQELYESHLMRVPANVIQKLIEDMQLRVSCGHNVDSVVVRISHATDLQ